MEMPLVSVCDSMCKYTFNAWIITELSQQLFKYPPSGNGQKEDLATPGSVQLRQIWAHRTWRKATIRDDWRRIVYTATLQSRVARLLTRPAGRVGSENLQERAGRVQFGQRLKFNFKVYWYLFYFAF